MNWGKWIIVSFVLFALFIGTLVTVCMRQDMSLVASDYYKQEINYQQRIDQLQNTAQLQAKPTISVQNSQLQIAFSNLNKIENGQVKLVRPSDSRFDKTFNVSATNDSIQSFDLSNQPRGMYKATLSWSMKEKEYFIEETVYL